MRRYNMADMIFTNNSGNYCFPCNSSITYRAESLYLQKNEKYDVVRTNTIVELEGVSYPYQILFRNENKLYLLSEEEYEKWFRFPIKTHNQIKIFDTEIECNEFLKTLDVECLKDVRFTDNQILVVYIVKGE